MRATALYDAISSGGDSATGKPIPLNRIVLEGRRLYATERAAADSKPTRVSNDTEIVLTRRANEPFIAQAT